MDKKEIKDFFDRLAPDWDNEPVSEKKIIDAILDNGKIVQNADVLDVGCGTGVLFPYYFERNVKSLTAVDISPKMAEIARAKFPDANVICGDAESIAFTNQFDAVMIHNAFPHFPNPDALIENLNEALKVGGTFSVAHSMSKEALDKVHLHSAKKVSLPLPEIEVLAKMLEKHFNIDIIISNKKMYQVVGTKR